LVELAAPLASAGRHAEAEIFLRDGAEQPTKATFHEVEALAPELCAKAAAKRKVALPQ
jgi:hypothetical protein